jgi:hypothetical protein
MTGHEVAASLRGWRDPATSVTTAEAIPERQLAGDRRVERGSAGRKRQAPLTPRERLAAVVATARARRQCSKAESSVSAMP